MIKRAIRILFLCVLMASVLSGCMPKRIIEKDKTNQKEEPAEKTKSKKSAGKENKEEKKEEKEEDTIVAGAVDTESKFTFSVTEAIIGIEEYEEEPIVALACSFTNNSQEPISFSWALEAKAVQNGYTLKDAYLSGVGDFNYNDIAPGSTIPVFIGWKILDAEKDITLTVVDNQHYAKKEIYSQTFTIDELIENTENYQDSGEIISEPLGL